MPTYGKPMAGICVATAVFLCSITGYPIPPAELPLADASMTVSGDGPLTFLPGASFVVVGDGFDDGAAVTISVYSEPQMLAEVVATEGGTVEAEVTLPENLSLGEHTVSAIGIAPSGDARALELPILVAPSDSLPFTGLDTSGVLLMASVLLIVGFGLVRSAVFGRPLYRRPQQMSMRSQEV